MARKSRTSREKIGFSHIPRKVDQGRVPDHRITRQRKKAEPPKK